MLGSEGWRLGRGDGEALPVVGWRCDTTRQLTGGLHETFDSASSMRRQAAHDGCPPNRRDRLACAAMARKPRGRMANASANHSRSDGASTESWGRLSARCAGRSDTIHRRPFGAIHDFATRRTMRGDRTSRIPHPTPKGRPELDAFGHAWELRCRLDSTCAERRISRSICARSSSARRSPAWPRNNQSSPGNSPALCSAQSWSNCSGVTGLMPSVRYMSGRILGRWLAEDVRAKIESTDLPTALLIKHAHQRAIEPRLSAERLTQIADRCPATLRVGSLIDGAQCCEVCA